MTIEKRRTVANFLYDNHRDEIVKSIKGEIKKVYSSTKESNNYIKIIKDNVKHNKLSDIIKSAIIKIIPSDISFDVTCDFSMDKRQVCQCIDETTLDIFVDIEIDNGSAIVSFE